VDEQKKIAWTLLYLNNGYAAGWRDEYIDMATKDPTKAWSTWDAFKKSFEQRFNDTMEKTTAQHQLESIRVEKAGSIDKFNQRFSDLARVALFDKEAQKVLYMKALPWWMHDRIIDLETQPKDIPALMAKALHYDLLSKQRRQGRNFNNGLYTVPGRCNAPALGTRSNPIHMERRWLSTEEVNEYQQKGLCFKCGKQGHMVRDCPNPDNQSGSNRGPRRPFVPYKPKIPVKARFQKLLEDCTANKLDDMIMTIQETNKNDQNFQQDG
jgi:hypothetical protein